MKNKIVILVSCLISVISLKAQVNIYSDFSGGNIIIDKIQNDSVWVRPDLRDTEGLWFYWYFAAKSDVEKTITFVFPQNCFSKAGVSVSMDNGHNWQWEHKEAFQKNNFTYNLKAHKEVRFSMGMPYTQSNWERFISSYKSNPAFKFSYLAETKKGRKAEMLTICNPNIVPKFKVLLTARNHACEMMADYVMEGVIETLSKDNWISQNVEILCIPFMDKDGVEDGDQGKNRRPRDHNRDYSQISIHETTAAMRKYIPVWSENKLRLSIDMHCPWIHSGQNDSIFFVGAQDKEAERRQLHFSELVKKNNKGELIYDPASFCNYGSKPWTIPSYPDPGTKCSTWALHLKGNHMAISLEFPFGVHGKQIITANNARMFGKDVGNAIIDYLKELDN